MSEKITEAMVDLFWDHIGSFAHTPERSDDVARGLAAVIDTMPAVDGWAWCDTDGNPVAFPWHSGVFRRSCSEWDDCPGPHYPLRKVQP